MKTTQQTQTEDRPSTVVWTTETPAAPIKGPLYCPHGKDAGQTCYPCDIGPEDDA